MRNYSRLNKLQTPKTIESFQPSVKEVPENFIPRYQKPASVGNFQKFTDRSNLCPNRGENKCQTYREIIMDPEVQHAGSKHFNNDSWTFQQDGTPAHTATHHPTVVSGLEIDLISKLEWPPSCPFLNSMDNCVVSSRGEGLI